MNELADVKTASWKVRAAALSSISEKLTTDKAAVVAMLKSGLASQLLIQANDLRSSVVKLACATIQDIGIALGEDFNSGAEIIIPGLLSSCASATAVIRDAASSCVTVILKHCVPSKSMDYLCMELESSRNAGTRAMAAKYLLQVLEQRSIPK